ncbi:uncharacterized protein LOC116164468 [Photinus pyralis]|uniref:uncharacterized protein LOC116164468 n=1 Tax=Photinus pyralis TaxID=7054 RepID=UPI0012670CCB|nr:uncharacterized protein LOC116164468 [Photinus pyralis]
MTRCLDIAHLNTRSLMANFSDLKEMLIFKKYDVLAVTETWLTSRISTIAVDILGYTFVRSDRVCEKRGGGVGMYIRKGITFSIVESVSSNLHIALEQLWIVLKLHNFTLVTGVIYRRQECAYAGFFEALEESLSLLMTHDVVDMSVPGEPTIACNSQKLY